MAQANRRIQHRTEREPNKLQEISELRQENKQLKRQVSRLRKQVELLGAEESHEDDKETVVVMPEESPSASSCPKCGSSNVGSWLAPSGKTLLGCRACKKWRSSVS